MPTIPLHPPSPSSTQRPNPLPQLLHTPTGLALLEIQGTVNTPAPGPEPSSTPIGKLVFPLYSPVEPENTAWMKRVYLYVGKHQRLTGEVKKLVKPVAVVRKRDKPEPMEVEDSKEGEGGEELEIVEIVRWKVLFTQRPEPVGVV